MDMDEMLASSWVLRGTICTRPPQDGWDIIVSCYRHFMVRPLSNAAGALFAGKTPDAVNIWIGDGRAVTSSETDVITSL